MHKTTLTLALAAALPFPGALLAETNVDERLENAERRIQFLERQAQIQQAESGDNAEQAHWSDRIELFGAIEVEAEFEDPDGGDSESSLTLSEVELGLRAQISEMVSGEIVLLYEDDGEEALDLDVASITLAPNESWSVTAGQVYVPFGVFESQMVSDPLTLELGETRETAVLVEFHRGIFGITGYLFDGEASEDGDSKIDNFGLNLTLTQEGESFSYDANLSYINDIGDSDTLIDYAGDVHDRVAGMAASLVLSTGPFTIIGEYVSALDSFTTGEEPSAFNLEAGYGFDLIGHDATVAIGVQGSDEADGVGLPEDVVLASLSMELLEETSLALEYAQAEDYAGDQTRLITLQLEAEF